MSFDTLGLCDALLHTVAEQGYTIPTPIQLEAIPVILSQRDTVAIAQTGTGKTAAFTLPIVHLLAKTQDSKKHLLRALIITPTRELAAQVEKSVQNYSQQLNIRSTAVYGGVRIEPQIALLQEGLDVLVATPGRLIDLYKQKAVNFEHLEVLVLDEADRMLDLGFIDDIRHIQTLLPSERQTLMFSATFSKAIKSLAKSMMDKPVLLEVSSANSTVKTVKQHLYHVDKERKSEVLLHLIKNNNWQQVLVFSKTKNGADSLALELKSAGITAESIHSNRSQHARTGALEGFKNGELNVLVATDIASRGIDINELPYVVNFDLPYVAEDYVHRIGRTGRAGTLGLAISLYCEDESKQLRTIERVTGHNFKREILAGFEPSKPVVKVSPAKDYINELYGNFEADEQSKRKGKGQKRKGRRRK
ncbi:MAG: ATP-dependent RNA helicase RhlE [Glaciecola sp.]|jgi:ATP-dependent RNA helicase RhlE